MGSGTAGGAVFFQIIGVAGPGARGAEAGEGGRGVAGGHSIVVEAPEARRISLVHGTPHVVARAPAVWLMLVRFHVDVHCSRRAVRRE